MVYSGNTLVVLIEAKDMVEVAKDVAKVAKVYSKVAKVSIKLAKDYVNHLILGKSHLVIASKQA